MSQVTDVEDAVRRLVRDAAHRRPGECLTFGEVLEWVRQSGHGVTRDEVRVALDNLQRYGVIDIEGPPEAANCDACIRAAKAYPTHG